MKTIAGYIYTCQVCEQQHLITNNETCKIIQKSKKIDLFCPHNCHCISTYSKEHFHYYHGDFWAVQNIIIDNEQRLDCIEDKKTNSSKEVVIDVQKGLILEIIKDEKDGLYVKVRKAEPGEKQPEFDEHYGYNVGKDTRFIF